VASLTAVRLGGFLGRAQQGQQPREVHVKHFAILAYAFIFISFVTVSMHGDAIQLILGTWSTFAACEFIEWTGDKISARCKARRAR